MSQKKRILYIEANRDGTIGGSYYSLLFLVQGLDKNKYEPCVLFCQDNDLIPEFRKETNCIYTIDFDPSVSGRAIKIKDKLKWLYRLFTEVIFKQFHLHKIIKDIQPDMVHLNNGYSALHEWMLAGYLHNVKVVCHDRGTRPPSSLRTKIFVRLVDAIICVSESYKNNVINDALKVKRLYRVYNGMESDKMHGRISSDRIAELRKQFNLQNTGHVVGIVGNIDEWKGQHIVLKAINIVKNTYPDIKCLIIGPICKGMEEYYSKLNQYIAENKLESNVLFTGYQKDVHSFLELLDVLIHASIEPEPFGRVILEGMAHAKPIIATNSGGTPEQIIDGETGILVPMEDYESMAHAITFMLEDKNRANHMGELGKKRLSDNFSVKNMVDGVEQVYENIFSSK